MPGGDRFGDLVWVSGDGEPEWATGGSYMAVRLIRMFVERWDRTPLLEQEAIIGRHKRTGAPMGAQREEDLPDLVGDPDGAVTPIDAHIRLANPRTPGSERNLLFRRGYSFSRGFDGAGLLDQGLLFVAFQRDLDAGFVTVQDRLSLRAAPGVHPAPGRRLLLRAAGRGDARRVPGRDAARLTRWSRRVRCSGRGASCQRGVQPETYSTRTGTRYASHAPTWSAEGDARYPNMPLSTEPMGEVWGSVRLRSNSGGWSGR